MDSFRPLVRFSGFGGEWEKVRLSDVAIINPQCSIPDSFEYVDLESVVGTVLYNHRRENKATAPSRAQRLARKGDIFYQTVRPYQRNNYLFELYESDYVFSTGYAQIRSNINPRFLFVVVQSDSFLKQVMDNCTGTSFPAINSTSLKSLIVCNCDSKEQHQISEYFTEIDRAISLQTEKLSKLKQIKAASLQNMFPQEGQMLPKVRFAGFEGEWERVRLGEIAQFFKGKGYSKNDLTEKGSPIFLYGMMYTKYRFAVNEVDTYTDKDFSSLLSQGNEVIIPASGETAEDIACASAFLIKDVILGGDLNVICFDLSLYSTPFIALSISNGSSRKYLSKCAQGKSVVHLRNSDIKTVVLSLPSLPEQQAIANYFTKLDRKIELETQKLEKLKQIKSACLSKMFV